MKTRMVAGWTDIFVARRMVNYRNFGYSTVAYTMFNHVKDLRDLDVAELAHVLGARSPRWTMASARCKSRPAPAQRQSDQVSARTHERLVWRGRCGRDPDIRRLREPRAEASVRDRAHMGDLPERHPEFSSEQAFADQRNRFGGLLLLPKDFNASYGDKPYAQKLPHYFGQNVSPSRCIRSATSTTRPSFGCAMSANYRSWQSQTSSRSTPSRRDRGCIRRLCRQLGPEQLRDRHIRLGRISSS